jgi:hypothetical protein
MVAVAVAWAVAMAAAAWAGATVTSSDTVLINGSMALCTVQTRLLDSFLSCRWVSSLVEVLIAGKDEEKRQDEFRQSGHEEGKKSD